SNNSGGQDIALDGDANAYVVGFTRASDFPVTPGAFDPSYNGDNDVFVAKLNAAGSALVYATFLGGSDDDQSSDIAIDGAGNAFVTGYTWSSDFPTTPGAFDTTHSPGWDAYVAKLDAAGSGLIYSTFLGGSLSDFGYSIAVDGTGAAFVSGRAQSTDFPTTPGVFDPTNVFAADKGFVAKLNPAGSDLDYSTYLGGSVVDHCYAIAIDGSGNAYVTGYTWSSDFPTTPGAFDTNFDGPTDAFAAKLNATGTVLEYSTFLGGADAEEGNGIALDGAGNAFVMGITYSSDFPTTPGAFDTSLGGSSDAFVAKLNSTGSGLDYSTYLGGSNSESYGNLALDGAGRAHVTASTFSDDFPITPGAFDTSRNGGDDAVVARLNASGSGLEYATYLGGASGEISYGIALDGTGNAFVTGSTYSDDFPTTAGAFDPDFNGFGDAYVTKLDVSPGPPTAVALTGLQAESAGDLPAAAISLLVVMALAGIAGLALWQRRENPVR
ncbi:MAG: SBBP repeat-containing protein, partial [Anaerolineae bacterium]|nr:SBBP repeat-containing protein [Anaerolineae bacterium]